MSPTLISSAVAVGYVRVSTEEQKLGPLAQRDAIANWSVYNALSVSEIFEDIGVSGTVEPRDRPGLAAALRCVQTTRADFLVVSARDRLSRDITNIVLLEAQLKRFEPPCRIVTATDDASEPVTPEQRVMTHIADAFAELERSKISERTKAGVRKARDAGRLPGPKKWSSFPRGRLTIQLLKRLKADGLSNSAIVSYCLKNSVFSPHRGAITFAHVRAALSSREEAADLDQTASVILDSVRSQPYYESKFVSGDGLERRRTK